VHCSPQVEQRLQRHDARVTASDGRLRTCTASHATPLPSTDSTPLQKSHAAAASSWSLRGGWSRASAHPASARYRLGAAVHDTAASEVGVRAGRHELEGEAGGG
jgi:hypothetical protein